MSIKFTDYVLELTEGKTEPIKNNNKYKNHSLSIGLLFKAIANPHEHGQNKSIKPIGLSSRINSK